MFKVRGADQKEYGPVNSEVLRQWIADGRINAQSLVQAEGTAEWKLVSAFPEFSAALAAGRPAPPLAATPYPAAITAAGPAKTSGMAVASLVLGILGMCTLGITALIGVVLGIVALTRINKSQGQLEGKGLAIAGIIVSGLFLMFIPIQAGLLLPALARAKSKAQTINCVSHLKQVALALRMYAMDNKDTLPAAAGWSDALQNYVGNPNVFQCPAHGSGQRSSYAFNAKLNGLDANKVSPQTVMLFECSGGWNVSGGQDSMTTHHYRTYVVALADGSVMQVPESRLPQLRWNP